MHREKGVKFAFVAEEEWSFMSKLLNLLKKQGGIKLIKQYFKSGALATAVCEFALLGKSRTALELLRLSASLKTKQKLQKQYKGSLEAFDREYNESLCNMLRQQSNKVWVCWFQGMEEAPSVVKKCYESLNENLTDRDIVLITSDNLDKYVDFPDFIMEKWKSGKITHTHMTDLLRLELLIKYGGTWIDATVLCTRKSEDIPEYFFNSDLFMFQTLKPGRDGHPTGLSSWYLSACTNNRVLMATRHMLYEYWKKNDEMVDYYLFHDFLTIALEKYEDEQKAIVPFSNSTPHILLLRLFDRYDERMYSYILEQTPFHKLSYKFTKEQVEMEGTYYKKVLFDEI